MTDRRSTEEAVFDRLLREPFYRDLGPEQRRHYAARAAAVEEALLPNLLQWLRNEPLTDVWINGKYCVGAVMKIRRDGNFLSALIALDDYAKDAGAEHAIWKRWA